MEDGILRHILREASSIAIVGLSDKPERPSFLVAEYLGDAGYEIIPVNPMIAEWKGRKSYAKLGDVPPEIKIDIVDVFRKSEDAASVAAEAVALNSLPKIIWLQEGVVSPDAEKMVEDASAKSGTPVFFVQDRCLKKEHARISSQG